MLEWTLLSELILLLVALLLGGISLIIARSNRGDPIYLFCSAFWRSFLWPPIPMEIDDARVSQRRSATAPRTAKKAAAEEDEDEKYGRIKREADGRIATVNLDVLVVPNAVSDQVLAMEDGGLKIQVTGEAGEGRTNKSLIELVSNALGIKPYQVTITKGHYHARKSVQVQGLRPDELQAKLASIG